MSTKTVTEYRIIMFPDSHYEIGDAENADEVNRILAEYGAYGFAVESRRVRGAWHTDWEMLDSCFGFLGNDTDYMLSEAWQAIPDGVESVPLYEDYGHGMRLVDTIYRSRSKK